MQVVVMIGLWRGCFCKKFNSKTD